MIGRVVSIKMNNTAVVLVTGTKKHPLYKKTYTHSKKFLADDLLKTKLGDIVEIVETKPISKRKFWKVSKVVGRDITEIVEEELKEQAAEDIAEVLPEEEEKTEEVVEENAEVKTEVAEKPKAKRKAAK